MDIYLPVISILMHTGGYIVFCVFSYMSKADKDFSAHSKPVYTTQLLLFIIIYLDQVGQQFHANIQSEQTNSRKIEMIGVILARMQSAYW